MLVLALGFQFCVPAELAGSDTGHQAGAGFQCEPEKSFECLLKSHRWDGSIWKRDKWRFIKNKITISV